MEDYTRPELSPSDETINFLKTLARVLQCAPNAECMGLS